MREGLRGAACLAVLLAVTLFFASQGCGTSPSLTASLDAAAPVEAAPTEASVLIDAAKTLGCTSNCFGLCGEMFDSCGNVVDCGGCNVGQVCGAGGPNRCGTGTCTPYCAPGACGSDGCAGLCESLCGAGLVCIAGVCRCDPTVCQGCCTDAVTCSATCPNCGATGTACCPGSTCNAGLSCDMTTNKCRCNPTTKCTCGEDDGCGGICTGSNGQCASGSGTGTSVCDNAGHCGCGTCSDGCCDGILCKPLEAGMCPVDGGGGGTTDASVPDALGDATTMDAADATDATLHDSSFDTAPPPLDSCVPQTCRTLDLTCGTPPDGCGGSLDCGSCDPPGTCVLTDGLGGVCQCVPVTCGQLGVQCGMHSDGCVGTLDCGTCASGSCDGNQCVGGSCGNPTQPCCSDAGCNTGSVCSDAGCLACGAIGETCCSGMTCTESDTICAGGFCEPCGMQGKDCCSGNSCTGPSGLRCVFGQCVQMDAGARLGRRNRLPAGRTPAPAPVPAWIPVGTWTPEEWIRAPVPAWIPVGTWIPGAWTRAPVLARGWTRAARWTRASGWTRTSARTAAAEGTSRRAPQARDPLPRRIPMLRRWPLPRDDMPERSVGVGRRRVSSTRRLPPRQSGPDPRARGARSPRPACRARRPCPTGRGPHAPPRMPCAASFSSSGFSRPRLLRTTNSLNVGARYGSSTRPTSRAPSSSIPPSRGTA